MKTTPRIAFFSLIAATILALPATLRAQDTDTSSTAAAPVKHKHGAPFHGTLDALDTNAMTLTVGSRTFQITSETRIMKDDKPAILADGVVGQPVTGYYKPEDAGTNLDASSVYFGKHTSARAATHKKKKPASDMTATNAPAVPPPMTSPVPPPPPAMPTPPPPPPLSVPATTNTNTQ
jgi:hypothetical protein